MKRFDSIDDVVLYLKQLAAVGGPYSCDKLKEEAFDLGCAAILAMEDLLREQPNLAEKPRHLSSVHEYKRQRDRKRRIETPP